VGLYITEEVVSANMVRLRVLTSIRIHPVVNISWVVKYRKPVEGHKVKEMKLVKVKEVKVWEVKKY